jgi:site-specific DNA-cytosine methylase
LNEIYAYNGEDVLVGFDGAGLSRLGLEKAGLKCVGVELDPDKHRLSKFVGSGNCILGDVTKIKDLYKFRAAWMSPPCQERSSARTQGAPTSEYAVNLLDYCLELIEEAEYQAMLAGVENQLKTLWVENVTVNGAGNNDWGTTYNAAQFLQIPIQNRNRVIGGVYPIPHVFREYKKTYPGICPCITASEHKGCATDSRRASRFYGRRLTVQECAMHQSFSIPLEWLSIPEGWNRGAWYKNLYEAIGNGVPCTMAEKFGSALVKVMTAEQQLLKLELLAA